MSERPRPRVTVEGLLVVLLLALGGFVRLMRLDWPPLAPAEARAALAAAAGTTPSPVDASYLPGDDPSYTALTSALFQAFGSSDGLARLVDALAGVAILAVPFLLRRRLGRGAAALAMALMAVSPALVMASRTAGSASLALLGITLAWVSLEQEEWPAAKRVTWAAAWLALGVASGPSAFTGLLGLAIAWLLHRLLFRNSTSPAVGRRSTWSAVSPWTLLLFLGVLIGVSTLLGLRAAGLPALAESFATWLRGWGTRGALGLGTAWIGLLVYEPFVLAAGVYAALRLRDSSPLNRWLISWFLAGSLVALVYPGRSAADFLWVMVPLTLLASQSLADVVQRFASADSKPIRLLLLGILTLLAAFAALQLAGYAHGFGRGPEYDPALDLWLTAGALALAVLVAAMFGLGWSWQLAVETAGLAACSLLIAQTISSGWMLNFDPSAASAHELWRTEATVPEARALLVTAQGVSQSQTGIPDALPIRIETDPSPALAWTLREFPRDTTSGVQAAEQPKVILRPKAAEASPLPAEYIGQTFTLTEQQAWGGWLPTDFLTWLVRRDAATTPEEWLLLVRADVASFGELPAEPAGSSSGG